SAFTSYTITATNSPTSYTVTGTLPAGLSFSGSTISGAPTASGTFVDTVKATNAGGTGTQILTITINAAIPGIPVITSGTTINGTINTAIVSYTITATNTPTSYSIGGTLPAGLSLSGAVISGTPTVSGTFIDTVKATNAGGTGTQVLTITINAPLPSLPIITSSNHATEIIGSLFSYTITATNSPTSYNATGLPAWLTVNSTTGVISGTPSSTGVFDVVISATNSAGSGLDTLTLVTMYPVPVILSSNTATGEVGNSFSYTIESSVPPTSYEVGGVLPPGLSFSPNGVISGVPTVSGTFIDTVKATNSTGTGTLILAITINASALGGGSGGIGVVILSPNPVGNGHFSVTVPNWNLGQQVGIEIDNFLGMLMQRDDNMIVTSSTMNGDVEQVVEVNVPNLIPGNYIIILRSSTGTIVKKFVVR
ncbi:MAG TPA: putative Ig domain-containing protein, partial [Ferruginibacter sp.]|nr:putative Ig domain-containing protein [Ferruginibacter sp.]